MNFWARSTRRERVIASSTAALLLTILLYLLLIAPYRAQLATLRSSLPARQADLAWMQTAALRVAQLNRTRPSNQGLSPLKVIDINARQSGIATNLKRIDPGGNEQIKVWFEDLIFSDLMGFLRKLDREHGIEVITLTAEKLDNPGRVNARVTFRTGR